MRCFMVSIFTCDISDLKGLNSSLAPEGSLLKSAMIAWFLRPSVRVNDVGRYLHLVF